MVPLIDLVCSTALTGVLAALAAAYLMRVWLHGDVHYDRVDQAGGSVLLNKRLMEMAYWGLQGIARACIALGITPDHITASTLGFALVAALAAGTGHFGVAVVFLVAGLLGDVVDGMVARLSGQTSRAGAVFDSVIDRYVESAYFFGLGYYFRDNGLMVALVAAALFGSYMVSYVSAKVDLMKVPVERGLMRRTERAVYLSVATGITPFAQLMGSGEQPSWVGAWPLVLSLGLIAVVANVSAAHRMFDLMRSLRETEPVAPAPVAVVVPVATVTARVRPVPEAPLSVGRAA